MMHQRTKLSVNLNLFTDQPLLLFQHISVPAFLFLRNLEPFNGPQGLVQFSGWHPPRAVPPVASGHVVGEHVDSVVDGELAVDELDAERRGERERGVPEAVMLGAFPS